MNHLDLYFQKGDVRKCLLSRFMSLFVFIEIGSPKWNHVVLDGMEGLYD